MMFKLLSLHLHPVRWLLELQAPSNPTPYAMMQDFNGDGWTEVAPTMLH